MAAYKWYTIAAGSSSAGGELKAWADFNKTSLARRMTREQIAEAEKLARKFLNVSEAEPNPAKQCETNKHNVEAVPILLLGPNVAIVASINSRFGFIILNAGSDNGLQAGEEYDVVRDGKLVGRVKINRTTELASIAIPTKTHAIAPLQRGDKVVAADFSRRP